LTPDQIQELVNHALAEAPHEACGLIAGTLSPVDNVGSAHLILPLPNAASTPQTQYEAAPDALLRAYQRIDAEKLALIGVYHSHPTSPPIPSTDDIRQAARNTPHAAHLIISLKDSRAALKAWHIQPDSVQAIDLLTGSQPTQQEAPLSNVQKYAIIIAAGLAVLILWWISFSLLPPAPPIPTS
jgi:proteasome lid subunit RPN8/RPN11